ILPKHIWEQVTSSEYDLSIYNQEPVGTGPFRLRSIERYRNGAYSSYTLSAFDNYALGRPYVDRLRFHFYNNEDTLAEAFERGEIDMIGGISPEFARRMVSRENP